MSFIQELKRRNVLRVALAYLAGAWLLIQIVETIFPLFDLSDGAIRAIVVALAIGFPVALIVSWLYELTPEGFRLEKDLDRSRPADPRATRRFDRAIIITLTLGLIYFAVDKFVLDPARDASREAEIADKVRSETLLESYGDKSIAVLPFVNTSADEEQEYFSDGFSEEILNLLAKIPELRVISRSSSFLYKGKDVDIPTIAEELNVVHVLEGSVRKSGNRIRITAQLIDGRSDTHLWSETYDGALDDIFATQDDIAAKVVEQLKLALLQGAPTVRHVHPDAYSAFLRGRYLRLVGSIDAYAQAIEQYQRSLEIDPNYPPAWEGLAEAYILQSVTAARPPQEGFRLGREAINNALEIDPNFGVGVAGLGWISLFYDHDLDAAARHFRRALELAPTDLDVISGVSFMADTIGRVDIAIPFKEYAVARDPLGPVGHAGLAFSYVIAGRYEEAVESAQIAFELQPDHIRVPAALGMALLMNGQTQEALQAIMQEPYDMRRWSALAVTHFEMGDLESSDEAIANIIETYGESGAYLVGAAYAWRGENDLAFEWLDKALAVNDAGLSITASDFWLRNLHDDPRWQPFLAKIGRSDEQLANISFDVTVPGSDADR